MKKFKLKSDVSHYRDWACKDAVRLSDLYREGYMDAIDGFAFSDQNPQSYTQGFATAVELYGDQKQHEEFKKILEQSS